MKARNKKTGEIVTNFGISKEWGTTSYIDSANTLRFSTPLDGEWEIIDDPVPVDWSSFRREAAKDALCAMIANNNIGYCGDSNARLAAYAIAIADELIKQLKQE